MVSFVDVTIVPTKLGAAGQRYRVLHENEVLVENTKDAPHDAARALVALGCDANAILFCYREGRTSYDFSGRVGYLAGTRTAEGQAHGPRTVGWVPYSGPSRDDDDDNGSD